MADSKIEWLDFDQWLKGRRVVAGKGLEAPLRMRKARRLLLGCDPADLEENVLDRAFAVMALCPEHTFQTLTKHPERMRAQLEMISNEAEVEGISPEGWIIERMDDGWETSYAEKSGRPGWPLPNVWLGVSVEDQAKADARIPDLLATPAAVRFVSYEPALGPVDFRRNAWVPWIANSDRPAGSKPNPNTYLDWIICGGESGPKARPMHPDWSRTARDQCQAAGVAFFFKQWGAWEPCKPIADGPFGKQWEAKRGHQFIMPDGQSHVLEDEGVPIPWLDGRLVGGSLMAKVGKKAAGRLLDGREWNEMPKGAGDEND